MTSPITRDDLHYELPDELIARTPAEPRDQARLLVYHRSDGTIDHRRVADLPEYLEAGDLLCTNNSSVVPARIMGCRADTSGRVEGLVLDSSATPWTCMLRSNGKLRSGLQLDLTGPDGRTGRLRLLDRVGTHWKAEPLDGLLLSTVGYTPLPPYILRARTSDGTTHDDAVDRRDYQTVYRDPDESGSVAAPTAGLHFTRSLLERIRAEGVDHAMVTLHVGAGTFAPITADRLEDHPMHEESWTVSAPTLAALRHCQMEGKGRIVAVGTTTVRVLESLPDLGIAGPGPLSGRTDLLIAPGWEFSLTDAMLTNFHLPESTLLALVGAFMGLEELKMIYRKAVESDYRFYSYGDAMLIL
ncbi:MAG: tRNA preQ1(34) S-adenosylmethionine ribosyltransferase-isomerase QueA [Planctomycetota bacterium]|nr:tRNA preQ1(34) S-adenosylmethionine ribosyltransferase-isomerase QueA [Planctomycetota bacterium]